MLLYMKKYHYKWHWKKNNAWKSNNNTRLIIKIRKISLKWNSCTSSYS